MAMGVKKSYRKTLIKYIAELIYCEIGGNMDEYEKLLKPVITVDNVTVGEPISDELKQSIYDMIDRNDVEHCYIDMKRAATFATRDVEDETHQAMEAMMHNLNTMHSRAGAQVPFSSLNYGTDTSPEGRLVMKSLLEVTFEGLGNGETPIFPIQIFKVKEGINYNPEDPNYDLFQLAMKVSAKRLFPNFSFMDAPYNLKYYKEGDPDTETGYMGAVSGDCIVLYESEGDGYIVSRFDTVYEDLAEMYGELDIGISKYVDLEPHNFMVFDTNAGGFVKAKKIIKNPNLGNWYRVGFFDTNGTFWMYMTEDHPLPIFDKGRVMVKDMHIGDRVASAYSKYKYFDVVSIERADDYDGYGYDFETVSDRFDVLASSDIFGPGINSHNCRTRVIANVVDKDREITPGRGNLSFTSVNLPRLAIEAHGDIDKFFESLKDMVELVIDQLLERFRFQCTKKVYNYPFMMGEGVWIDSDKLESTDSVAEVLKHGTLTCGFIGLAETLKCLIGKHHGESEEAQQLGLKIIKFMRTLMDNACEEYKLNFSLIATPEL